MSGWREHLADVEPRSVTQMEDTTQAMRAFGGGAGDVILLTDQDIAALKTGKVLGFDDGEYTHFLVYSLPGAEE